MGKETGHLHAGHRDRMRERYKKNGFEDFEPHEVLEMVLFYVLPRVNTNDIAHALIDRFHTLAGVMDADLEDLREVPGVGERAALFLKMLPDIFREYRLSKDQTKKSAQDRNWLKTYITELYKDVKEEQMYIVCLDTRMQVIWKEKVGDGTCNSTLVQPRSIVEIALRQRSSSIILIHNHPDGDATPSSNDLLMTRRVYTILRSLDVRLEDHYIVGDRLCSMREMGYWSSVT